MGTKDRHWHASLSVQQYRRQDAENPDVGWGGRTPVFAGNPHPIGRGLIGGIGGQIKNGDDDRTELGYFYYGPGEDLKSGLDEVEVGIGDERGIEAFYSLAVAPRLRVRADLDWIDPATRNSEDTIIGAARTQIRF